MLIGATIAGGRENVEDNPTTKLSHAIQGDKGILLTETTQVQRAGCTVARPDSHSWKPALI